MKPKILLIIGPTAVGKSSIIERAQKDYPRLYDVITYTTRPMRGAEGPGQPYHFIDEAKFKALIQEGFFIEWANVHGRLYGTPRDQVEAAGLRHQAVIMDIDVQGAKKVRQEFPQTVCIFLMPPSMDALRQRFIKRGVTDDADLSRRLVTAQGEIAQAQDFEHVLINDDFDTTYTEIRKIIENLLNSK